MIIIGLAQIVFGILVLLLGYRVKEILGVGFIVFMIVMATDLAFTSYLLTQRSMVLSNLSDFVFLLLTVLAPIIGIAISFSSLVYFTVKSLQK